MEEVDKGCLMTRMGVSGWMFLLVPAYPVVPDIGTLNGCVYVCVLMSRQSVGDCESWPGAGGTVPALQETGRGWTVRSLKATEEVEEK